MFMSNGIVAIVAGWIAQSAVDYVRTWRFLLFFFFPHSTSPFYLPCLFAVVCCFICLVCLLLFAALFLMVCFMLQVGHPVAPFDVSFSFLAVGTVIVLLTWPENYG